MNNLLTRLFTSDQRQSLVISLTVFFTSLLLIVLISVLVLITFRGSAYFWPEPIYSITYQHEQGRAQSQVLAQLNLADEDTQLYSVDYADSEHPFGSHMLLPEQQIVARELATNSARVSLHDGRAVLAIPQWVITPQNQFVDLAHYDEVKRSVSQVSAKIDDIRTKKLANIHESLAALDTRGVAADAPAREKLIREFTRWHKEVLALEQERDKYKLQVTFADQQTFYIKLSDIRRVDYLSRLSSYQKARLVLSNVITFLTDTPKQANTAGGVFPALFGTVLMVFIMTIIVTPFGVLAAIYLSEYAPDTAVTSAIRISVSNMAGVPSIVYGVFGLGFFVYTLGGNIDELFFSDKLPAPTMGAPGVFWASLTMAILTLPVVIVATEEGLRRVPEGLKAGSYALGATKVETIVKTILPIASPGIMTGVILAIARAAGEVAPLMMVGAVKFAPNLPIDGEFPFLHVDRQFMHLGVLIYDGAFHSQTDAKDASMMFASCLLLLVVVFVLNILAVILRTRLRKRYLQG